MQLQGLTPLLQVFDLAASLAFYRDVLGFAVISQSDPSEADSYWMLLRRDDATLMLNTAYETNERPAIPDPARVAAHRDTALFFGCDSVAQVAAHLQARQWPAEAPVTTAYGMRQIYTRDPDGFELCFQHPAAQES